ncbi:MBOAT family protein [Nemorincola caseinilytica]|uniref:MBOAT family protein n=1 Tax=Nemorincola caseinilytica TaxID=2054315 RepID=A0ABP8NBH2_9BACT
MITVGYLFARAIEKQENQSTRKAILTVGIVILGFGLTYIKYSGLILGNITGLQQWQASALHILVPLGISYYTFSSIGYIVDVYRRRLPAERNFITYSSYISFFPHLLSGPIPSSVNVLPQFSKITIPDLAKIEHSAGEIIWGLFKKMVLAAHAEKVVNYCYASYDDQNGSTLFLGVMLFNLYLYADFSAYSDIARGVGRLMGIELTQNFKMPFFSRNPGEFWRRWHTSLRKWMLDYLYLPLGGNRGGKLQYIMAIVFIFSFSGLWHGANMTFVCWGLLNGIYFIPYILTDSMTRYKDIAGAGRLLPSLKETGQIAFTFLLTTLSRIFFRAPNMTVVNGLVTKIFSVSIFAAPIKIVWTKVIMFVPMLAFEWVQREKLYVLQLSRTNAYIRVAGYLAVIVLTWLLHKEQNASEYYYFKF